MTAKKIAIAAFLAGFATTAVIAANGPLYMNSREHSRVGGQAWAMWEPIDAADTECLPLAAGGSTCALFGFRSTVHITVSGGDATCCWSGRTAPTLGAQTSTHAVVLTDASTSGACAGKPFLDGEGRDMMPLPDTLLRAAAGNASGLCPVAVLSTGNRPVRAICAIDGDCTPYGGGTCSIAPNRHDFQELGGVPLYCRPDTDATEFRASLER